MLWQLFALEPDKLTALERTLLRVALSVGLVVAVWTWGDAVHRPGDDLRNRVVGARVMLLGKDPYAFFWQPDMPEELLDPVHDPDAHRLTISPPTLLLYAPLAPLPFRAGRLISFLCEWLAMLASLALLARALPEARQRVVFLCISTAFVLATDIWRLHLERGQVYVVPLLGLSVAVCSSRRGQVDSIAAGLALGVVALVRPNLLVIAPALLLARRWRCGGAMLATVGVGVAVTCLVLPAESWRSYLGVGDQYYRSIEGRPLMQIPSPEHAGPVEGVTFGADSLTNIESSSFAQLVRKLHDAFGVPMIDLALTSKLILAGLAATLLVLVWRRRGEEAGSVFALIVVLALDTEFFLPHRWGYADVMLLAPLALLLPELLRPERVNMQALAVVLLGLLCGPLGQLYFGLYTATLLRSGLVMAGLTRLALRSAIQEKSGAEREISAPRSRGGETFSPPAA
jgi:hypothetical protein